MKYSYVLIITIKRWLNANWPLITQFSVNIIKISYLNTLLIDSQYFPVVNYYSTLFQFKHIQIDIYERHQKLSFCNRCVIAGAHGIIKLTVPLVGGRDQKSELRDLKIDYSFNWRTQHLRSVVSAYNRSPYFEHFKAGFSSLFETRPVFLFDWNQTCMYWLMEQTGANWTMSDTSLRHEENQEQLIDMRRQFTPKSPYGASQKTMTYRQVFQERNGFQPNLSIIDLLFCAGPVGVQDFVRYRHD